MGNNFSLLNLFTGDIMTLFISLVLVGFSVMTWAVIIEKIRLWRMEKKNPIALPNGENSPKAVEKLVRPFERNMWFLSMVSYVSPFIGLFGTIWGVMDSFASIGVNQSVSIGVIAPGLATALGTTALGLIAAIPAAIGYQYFMRRADDLYDRLEDARIDAGQKNKKTTGK